MKKKRITASALAFALLLCGCAREVPEEAEIQIPIFDDSSAAVSYRTAEAELRDFTSTMSVGGQVEYAFADTLSVPYDTNILSYEVKKGDVLKKGDTIAVFDPSAFSYDYQNQKIVTDNAYSEYLSSGSEAARLEYETENARLELIQYHIDEYTITAPYDCVVTSVERFETGSAVPAGTPVCSVARQGDVYVCVKDNKDVFAVGMRVGLKFGTDEVYSAKVAMTPVPGGKGVNSLVVIRFDEGEYERAAADVGNIVAAGWVTVLVDSFKRYAALCVPSEAVMQYSGSTYIYLDNNGDRARIPVETAEELGGYTIISSGLSEGDKVSY